MNAGISLFYQSFPLAIDTPDGIKNLRALILTLAMQGKLVPQDPKDQPASELLKDIEGVKKKQFNEGKLKKIEQILSIKQEEIPFAVPLGWEWAKLGNIVSVQTGKKDVNEGHDNGKYPFFSCAFEPLKSNNYSFDCEALLLPGNGANVGQITYYKGKFEAYQRTYVLSNFCNIFPRYIEKALNAMFHKSIEGKQYGSAINYIKIGNLLNFIFPLPPLAEQKRIVAKIDELMALCDELEKERDARNQKRRALHTSAVNRLLTSADATSFETSWQFIAKNFGELYSVKENVAELKKAILQLAVMGKLVPQDPNDQPASELLKEIESDPSTWLDLAHHRPLRARKKEALPPIKPEEIPYEVPKGWEWVRLSEICHDWGQKKPDRRFTYIDVGAIDNSKGIVSDNIQILNSDEAPSRARKIVKRGTVIYSTVRPYLLNIAIIEKDYEYEPIASTAFAILHPFKIIDVKYLYYYLRSSCFIGYVEAMMKGVAYPAINDGDFFRGYFPLPPIAAQKCIVAKVDELMALCDALEKQIDDAEKKRERILDSVMKKVGAFPRLGSAPLTTGRSGSD